MPTYDYICNACGHEFELFQQMSHAVKRKCPECGKAKLERLIGIGAGVLFKGGGFYETDYRSDSYTKAADADKKSAEGKTESVKTAETPATPAGETKAKSEAPSAAKETASGGDAAKAADEKRVRKSTAKPAASKADSRRKTKSKR